MRRAWGWVVELAEHHALETIVVSTAAWPRPSWPFPGRLDIVAVSGKPIKPRHLHDWIDPDAATAEVLANLDGPVPERIVVFRLQLHDVAALLPADWRAKAEIDCDDWETGTRLSITALFGRYGRWRDAVYRGIDAVRHAGLERRTLGTYQAVHVSAPEDARWMKRCFGLDNLVVRPNRIAPIPDFSPAPLPSGGKTLFFVGTLGYLPNEDAVRWIGKAIAPALRRLEPEVVIAVAGTASDDLRADMAAHGLLYLHAPDNLDDIYAKTAVVVAPLRGGGGTKMKVLEAWQHGRPVVATSHGARGLDAEPGRHLLVADDAERFASACADLLARPDYALSIAQAGADLLRARFLLGMPPGPTR